MNHPIMMEALAFQFYDNKRYILGEAIPVKDERDASDMEALHLAKRLPPPTRSMEAVQDVAAIETTRNMEVGDNAPAAPAESAVAKAPSHKDDKQRGKYSHRAVQARS
jgi:hypothetical protein